MCFSCLKQCLVQEKVLNNLLSEEGKWNQRKRIGRYKQSEEKLENTPVGLIITINCKILVFNQWIITSTEKIGSVVQWVIRICWND